ncbi:hypothetical protein DWX97_10450 [Bacteroides cellulosilyticus]|uniref:Uncharacterized protein n=1 Tax=Bacteroides cellulosilyticus TaxID=246787 RepID=A0A412II92_9BACE|nr:hypothetical protein [Bacteroides cellulosilyticus]RGS36998.1 hypothetical protein DWX97_10450 [Bacteroides cellulosilyticus]
MFQKLTKLIQEEKKGYSNIILYQNYQYPKHKLYFLSHKFPFFATSKHYSGKHVLRGNPQRLQNEKHIN